MASAGPQRGSALVAALVLIAIIAGLGMSLLLVAQTDARMSQAGLRAKRAFFYAEAGLEEARKAIHAANLVSADPGFNDELDAAGSGDDIDLDPAALGAVFDSNGNVTGFNGATGDTPVVPLTSFAGGTYAAFLSNDALETDGIGSRNDTNDRVMVTAIGTGPSRSAEVVQAILERVSLPQFPAGITLLGDSPHFDGGTSAAKKYTGNDCEDVPGVTGQPGYAVPTVGTTSVAARDEARDGVKKPGSFTSGGNTGISTVEDVSATMDPQWTDCAFLSDLVYMVKEHADYVCTSASHCSHWSTSTPNTVTHAEGDLTLESGQGLLLVTGKLTIDGNSSWSGVLLVIGEGEVKRSGGGDGHTWGTTFVANIAGPDKVFGTADDCSEGTGGIDNAKYTVEGGGNHEVAFCSALITEANQGFPLKIVDFRQR